MPGRSTGKDLREKLVAMFTDGRSMREISSSFKMSFEGVRKIVNGFVEERRLGPKPRLNRDRHTVVTTDVLRQIEFYKRRQPSVYAREIQQRLIDDGVCVIPPSFASISMALKELNMTKKRLTSCPSEKTKNEELFDIYFSKIATYSPQKQHHFDESSVIRTTGNRTYGHSYRGTPAVEIQRFASNANFTINCLVSYFGIDYYDVIEGASNGLEMVNFFDEATDILNSVGNPILARGDCVVMDNCGFHHGRIAERTLRELLNDKGIELIFQPPYSPELNVCEYAFGHIKRDLKSF